MDCGEAGRRSEVVGGGGGGGWMPRLRWLFLKVDMPQQGLIV